MVYLLYSLTVSYVLQLRKPSEYSIAKISTMLERTKSQKTIPIKATFNRDYVVNDETMRWYLSSIGSKRLLEKDEEIQLALAVKHLIEWNNAREELKINLGREPTKKEWAMSLGFDGTNKSLNKFEKRLKLFEQCKERMITSNLRLVVSIAKKYTNRGVNIQDLIQEGSMGLIKAVEKFDIERNCRFSTYAHHWIKQAITRGVASYSRPIRIPIYMTDCANSIKRARKIFYLANGYSPTDSELAGILGISESKFRRAFDSNRLLLSLDAPYYQNILTNEEKIWIDIIQDKKSVPEDSFQDSQLNEELYKIITNVLNTQEREILFLKYGLMGRDTLTMDQISKIYQCPKDAIQKIYLRSLRRLRNTPQKSKLFSPEYEK